MKIDYYVRHPRESRPLDLGAPLLEKHGLIAEEAILKASPIGRPTVVGHFSSVLFNLDSDQARKVMLLFEGDADTQERARLAQLAGCEVVVI